MRADQMLNPTPDVVWAPIGSSAASDESQTPGSPPRFASVAAVLSPADGTPRRRNPKSQPGGSSAGDYWTANLGFSWVAPSDLLHGWAVAATRKSPIQGTWPIISKPCRRPFACVRSGAATTSSAAACLQGSLPPHSDCTGSLSWAVGPLRISEHIRSRGGAAFVVVAGRVDCYCMAISWMQRTGTSC